MSVGVKVTLSGSVPHAGTVAGVVQAKAPGTEAVPPVSVDAESAAPAVMALAAGHADMVGAALFTVSSTLADAVV